MTSNKMQAKNEKKEFNLDYVVQSVELIISSDSFTTEFDFVIDCGSSNVAPNCRARNALSPNEG